ncbi:depupylase/deamidase Dop [Rothia aerolata]|uniref:Proteasome accessory factor PafA2 n=1 Tax=Rothia aerolata TaxID=1812262 RepID=A0A917IMC8_9MICC|nr:depupylase/deamidase Dop [Rothia aerolata]GGH57444.1 proteasome accessory factor PafA2 [Rothia aerolata]
MTVERVMGAETEYGILAPEQTGANPTVLSAQVVNTYDTLFHRALRARSSSQWEYSSESPLADSRGGEMSEEQAHPSQLTHRAPVLTSEEIAAEALKESGLYAERLDWDSVTMNSILPNGARFYVDHAHPEYSSPEVTNPLDAVLWDAAGDHIAAQTVATIEVNATESGLPKVNLYKNNTDSKGQSYGAHENYLLKRSTNFDDVVAGLLPFFATRGIMIGAGRVGIGTKGEKPGFQITQRADFFERLVGLETTIRRPLVNTRDEPHADINRYRRLHVITGDANLSHYSNLLKFGTMSLVLNLIEAGQAPQIKLADPVAAMHTVSHNLTLAAQLPLAGGGTITALEIQGEFLDAARELEGDCDAATQQILDLWEQTLHLLETDLFALADRLDWVAKYQLLSQYVSQGLGWDNPKLAAIDLQYSDIRPHKGLYFKLVQVGRMKTLFDEATIEEAAHNPPENTRAYLRGKVISTWPEEIVSVNWDTIVARDPLGTDLYRLNMPSPSLFTKSSVEHLLKGEHAGDLISWLNGQNI